MREVELDLLYIKRADRDTDRWSGHIAFPGGNAKPYEREVDCAARETLEEIGIDPLDRYEIKFDMINILLMTGLVSFLWVRSSLIGLPASSRATSSGPLVRFLRSYLVPPPRHPSWSTLSFLPFLPLLFSSPLLILFPPFDQHNLAPSLPSSHLTSLSLFLTGATSLRSGSQGSLCHLLDPAHFLPLTRPPPSDHAARPPHVA